jgi:hypothetical protein
MASRVEADPRRWGNFWGHKDKKGNRYRHQIKQHKKTKLWSVRTEILDDSGAWPYCSAETPITAETAAIIWEMKKVWTNVGEELCPMYPPQFAGGFK